MRALAILVSITAAVIAALAWWRRHPRVGSAYVNRVIDPWLVRNGILDKTHGEIGLVEHVGRRSGVVRTSPVHPVASDDGFRIVVPLGVESQWAQNVLAAGHCRIELGGIVHELDHPSLVAPTEVAGLPKVAGQLMSWLGMRYLILHRVGHRTGTLDHSTGWAEVSAAA